MPPLHVYTFYGRCKRNKIDVTTSSLICPPLPLSVFERSLTSLPLSVCESSLTSVAKPCSAVIGEGRKEKHSLFLEYCSLCLLLMKHRSGAIPFLLSNTERDHSIIRIWNRIILFYQILELNVTLANEQKKKCILIHSLFFYNS
jgi:hypothetical protein